MSHIEQAAPTVPVQTGHSDEEACRSVVAAYYDAIDRGRATEAEQYMTADAVIVMRGKEMRGDEIVHFLREREAMRDRHTLHLLVDLKAQQVSPDTLDLDGRLLVHAMNQDGNYDLERILDVGHRLRRSPGGWQIAVRSSNSIHASASSDAGSPGVGTDSSVRTPRLSAAPMQMTELVLKTARFDEMKRWYSHMLGHGPFFERVPDQDAPPRPPGMPERAVDVYVAFFEVHDNGHPYSQVLGLFGIDSLADETVSGPGLHHFQFCLSGIGDLISQYQHMLEIGAVPHRAANHGQATSYYFRDPDSNIVEFSVSNMPTKDEVHSFMATPDFAANPSGLELEPAEFAARYWAGEPLDALLKLPAVTAES